MLIRLEAFTLLQSHTAATIPSTAAFVPFVRNHQVKCCRGSILMNEFCLGYLLFVTSFGNTQSPIRCLQTKRKKGEAHQTLKAHATAFQSPLIYDSAPTKPRSMAALSGSFTKCSLYVGSPYQELVGTISSIALVNSCVNHCGIKKQIDDSSNKNRNIEKKSGNTNNNVYSNNKDQSAATGIANMNYKDCENEGSNPATVDKQRDTVERKLSIGTHSGTFHCDEVLAVVMLRYLKEYRDAEIVRTRDQAILDTCDIVVDVGGVYDSSKMRFDHHQSTFNECFDENSQWKIKMSSAGLIYKHFGKRMLLEGFISQNANIMNPEEVVDMIYPLLYRNFIEMVDANDNGIAISNGEMKYKQFTALPNRVNRLNRSWNSPDPDTPEVQNANFMKATKVAQAELEDHARYLINDWLPARSYVQNAFDERFNNHASGQIIVLERWCPYMEHLFEIEESTPDLPAPILFCLYPSGVESSNLPASSITWKVQAISVKDKVFQSRLPLAANLRGLSGPKLNEAANIPGVQDLIFVHATGFLGGAKSKSSCIELAVYTMEASSDNA